MALRSAFFGSTGAGPCRFTPITAPNHLVLQGGFSDGNGHYAVGDIAYADDDVNHKPVADPDEVCICFAVVDAPVELTGPFGRLMNTFRR
jgi:putative transcriptional regulator